MPEVKKECNNCKFYKIDYKYIMQGICKIHTSIRSYNDKPQDYECKHYEWNR